MSIAMVLARQFQNRALAGYPDAVREIAVFAYASSVYWLFNAVLAFVPQMANALGRSPRSRRVCLTFTSVICAALALPLFLLGALPAGRAVLAAVFGIEGPVLDDVARYVRWLAPLVPVGGLRHYYVGLLVQSRRTGIVAALNVLFVTLVLAVLLVARRAGLEAVTALVLMQAVPLTVHLAGALVAFALTCRQQDAAAEGELTYRKALAFFWPVALAGLMFALSRPIIFSFMGRAANSQRAVAALRVGFDLSMLFQLASNQFRHVFVTFGAGDLAGLRRFMIRIVLAVTGLMLLVALTPLKRFFFGELLGLHDPVLTMAGQVLLVMCAVPAVIAWRNYYHGLALIHHRTVGMGIGGISRNATTFLLCWGLLSLGLLDHSAGATVLVCGFAAEAAAVVLSTRGWRRELPPEEGGGQPSPGSPGPEVMG